MKLKVVKRDIKEVETEYDLPVYLYFQDEMCNDELVKITEDKKITIKYQLSTLTITVESNFWVEDVCFERCLTTPEHFNEVYTEAIEQLSEAVKDQHI